MTASLDAEGANNKRKTKVITYSALSGIRAQTGMNWDRDCDCVDVMDAPLGFALTFTNDQIEYTALRRKCIPQ